MREDDWGLDAEWEGYYIIWYLESYSIYLTISERPMIYLTIILSFLSTILVISDF